MVSTPPSENRVGVGMGSAWINSSLQSRDSAELIKDESNRSDCVVWVLDWSWSIEQL